MASVTKISTGNYTVTFLRALADVGYAALASSGKASYFGYDVNVLPQSPTTLTVQVSTPATINTTSAFYYDPPMVSVVVYR